MIEESHHAAPDPQAHLMQSLIQQLVCSLVKDVHEVKVAVLQEGNDTVFNLSVSARDLTNRLTAGGRTIQSIETIVNASGTKFDRSFVLRVHDIHGPQLVADKNEEA
jgi:predicted RNA-binding protein YlqC (UPF0109 family)